MGIRVDKEALLRQLKLEGQEEKNSTSINDCSTVLFLSLSVVVSDNHRLCMFFLRKAHIGEIQSSIWPDKMREDCKKYNINLI